jgi:hypothetical protein
MDICCTSELVLYSIVLREGMLVMQLMSVDWLFTPLVTMVADRPELVILRMVLLTLT